LPRLDGELGTFLGLTGHRLKGEDAYIAGFGTHFVPASRLNGLMERLKELETDELDVVNGIIDEFSGKALFNLGTISKEKFSNWQLGGKIGEMIDRVFKFDTIEEILVSLAKECSSGDADIAKFATTQHEILKSVSPTSLKVTLEQIRRGAKMDIASCFRMEYQMVKEFLTTPDFDEGVTAKLIEKRSPVWKPSFEKIQSILKSDIETKYFLPTGPKLELLNRLSYYDYPHRTLSGLPTDRDVKRVVNGEGRRGAVTMKPRTRKEVLDWILQNWGRYDTGVIGYSDQNMPTRNTLDGGYGRGKIGLLEKVQAILELHTVETDSGLNWK
jgi:3-hydroxyisobutyryl-CoA hydrolase